MCWLGADTLDRGRTTVGSTVVGIVNEVHADADTSAPGSGDPVTASESGDRERRRSADRILRRRPSPAGLATALVFFGFSLTPSLVPRDPPFQAVVSGLSVISGYALGATTGAVLRRMGFRLHWRQSRTGWLITASVALAGVVTMMILGANWQNDLRALMGMPDVGPDYTIVVPVALAIGFVLLVLGRCVRWAAVHLGELIDRWLPRRVAMLIATVLVGVLVFFVISGVLVASLLDGVRATFSVTDQGTPEGVSPPVAAERSGSPLSPISWDSLGRQGRVFVAGGRTTDELAAFAAARGADVEAKTPIRVYAGLRSVDGEDLDEIAALVVAELDRTNAWDRQILVVATATGTGWIDPAMPEALELLHAGDTAIASMQYSFLPSWASFAVDRATPPVAGRALFEAVYDAWVQQPEDRRPLLMTFGLSLGAYGGQGAFSGLQDMLVRTDGAVWVGTPSFTPMWRDLTDGRDAGSLERSPVYRGGEHVRWGTGVDSALDVWDLGEEWAHPRVVYVQHASDGVVWWSPDLWFRRPDWIREPPGPDVLPYLWWMPLVTFWQVTMDMFVAAQVPDGHGHNYRLAYADAWAAVAPPDGWTHADTHLLRAALTEIFAEDD
jgi:uncharacterized membrane protein